MQILIGHTALKFFKLASSMYTLILVFRSTTTIYLLHSAFVMSSDYPSPTSSAVLLKQDIHDFALLHAKVDSSIELSLSNLAFLAVDFEDVEDFKNSLGVNFDVDKPEVESSGMVFRKGFTFVNLQ